MLFAYSFNEAHIQQQRIAVLEKFEVDSEVLLILRCFSEISLANKRKNDKKAYNYHLSIQPIQELLTLWWAASLGYCKNNHGCRLN